ncbi:MAG: type II toxin-antitoxin system VapC family toxin [Acidobacteria bacterium]|nr:type II toxin-antitoxin system VapC family toxin [Acidobacteriota bacterium]
MIVVDASALLEVLLRTPSAERVEARLFAPGQTLHAPHLLDLEIAQVLRRYTAAGELDPQRAAEALQDLADFPVERYPHILFLPRIWQLRHQMTAYDAAYVALAEVLEAPLVTRDSRVERASDHDAKVELL